MTDQENEAQYLRDIIKSISKDNEDLQKEVDELLNRIHDLEKITAVPRGIKLYEENR